MNCRQAEPKLSEYIDNALSARGTWELDRHLARCPRCARALAEMAETVHLVGAAPRYELSEEFAARLEARIASIEPAPARRAWMLGLSGILQPRGLPVWGLGAAACALIVVVLLSNGPTTPTAPPIPPEAQAAHMQSVTLSASDPLQDLATANLAAGGDSTADIEEGR